MACRSSFPLLEHRYPKIIIEPALYSTRTEYPPAQAELCTLLEDTLSEVCSPLSRATVQTIILLALDLLEAANLSFFSPLNLAAAIRVVSATFALHRPGDDEFLAALMGCDVHELQRQCRHLMNWHACRTMISAAADIFFVH